MQKDRPRGDDKGKDGLRIKETLGREMVVEGRIDLTRKNPSGVLSIYVIEINIFRCLFGIVLPYKLFMNTDQNFVLNPTRKRLHNKLMTQTEVGLTFAVCYFSVPHAAGAYHCPAESTVGKPVAIVTCVNGGDAVFVPDQIHF
jgi:hypothetical protein